MRCTKKLGISECKHDTARPRGAGIAVTEQRMTNESCVVPVAMSALLAQDAINLNFEKSMRVVYCCVPWVAWCFGGAKQTTFLRAAAVMMSH